MTIFWGVRAVHSDYCVYLTWMFVFCFVSLCVPLSLLVLRVGSGM